MQFCKEHWSIRRADVGHTCKEVPKSSPASITFRWVQILHAEAEPGGKKCENVAEMPGHSWRMRWSHSSIWPDERQEEKRAWRGGARLLKLSLCPPPRGSSLFYEGLVSLDFQNPPFLFNLQLSNQTGRLWKGLGSTELSALQFSLACFDPKHLTQWSKLKFLIFLF